MGRGSAWPDAQNELLLGLVEGHAWLHVSWLSKGNVGGVINCWRCEVLCKGMVVKCVVACGSFW